MFIGSRNPRWYRVVHRMLPRLSRPVWREAGEELARVVSQYRIDIVLAHFATTAVQFADVWEKLDAKLLIWCHGYDVTWDLRRADAPDLQVHDSTYKPRLKQLAVNAKFLANSNFTARKLAELGVARDSIQVNYLGAPIVARPPHEVPDRDHRRLKVLYLGRLVDCKGPDMVIRAFEVARNNGFLGDLIVAGDGPLRITCELMRARSPYRDDITITGFVTPEEANRLRNEADIFTAHNQKGVVTGQEEALGISILEAMGAGLPVVTGRSGGVTETVIDGTTGFLISPGDIGGHADALMRLSRDPELRVSMGRAGWERVRTKFSMQEQTKRLKDQIARLHGSV